MYCVSESLQRFKAAEVDLAIKETVSTSYNRGNKVKHIQEKCTHVADEEKNLFTSIHL